MFAKPQGMNPRHAAALALAAWYLMVPPDRPKLTDPFEWISRVPFRDWQIVQRFDAASACEKRKHEIISDAIHATNPDAKARRTAALLSDIAISNNATCVSRDDPRLKETK
ncbi:hypothetical protein [Candidatus Binatus sp.]|uniref:hypothetical protein n=1 Tax=Candidatus Binatus sp. TaxID=2811406 RepID=UPI003C1513BE